MSSMRVNTVPFNQGLGRFFSLNDDRKASVNKVLDGLLEVESESFK